MGGIKDGLFTGGEDGVLKYWSQALQVTYDGKQGSAIKSIYALPDGSKVYTAGGGGTVKIWDVPAHKLLTGIEDISKGGVNAIAVSPDGKLILTGGADGNVKAWSADGNLLKTVDAHTGGVNAILYISDKKADTKPEDKKADVKPEVK